MKQVLQDLKTGDIEVMDVPDAIAESGCVLVRVEASLISAGTEGHQISGAGKSLLERAIEKPQLVKKGIQNIYEHGVAGLRNQIASKYSGYGILGYSCAGIVVACGEGVTSYRIGQRVACGGMGYANHAELANIPINLCAVAGENVSAECAAYTTLGSIAMQGVRQANVKIGETVVVIGLGLVGLLTTQILLAAGCVVLGIDPSNDARIHGLANGCAGTSVPSEAAAILAALSRGIGADAVIICAATPASDPVVLAGELARSRGRVVMVGATGMDLPREVYYRKELTFVLSRSYGPGRYDRHYEADGCDYPVDYVRFTEQRNMQCYLDLLSSARIDSSKLTTHRFALSDARQAYSLLALRQVDRVGIVLSYPFARADERNASVDRISPKAGRQTHSGGVAVSFIGAGAYAKGVLLRLFARQRDVHLCGVVTRSGATSLSVAKQFGFAFVANTPEEIFRDDRCNTVVIATRHDTHAVLAAAALSAGKNVWVEKPLALTPGELRQVRDAWKARPDLKLVVGFNRPFSPLIGWIKREMPLVAPMMITYRVNAGLLPGDHWANDPAIGGGRLRGEGCHFLDLIRSFCGDPVTVSTVGVAGSGRADLLATGNFTVTVAFCNGSIGTVIYSSQGSPRLPKERIEIFCGNACGVIDDFKHAKIFIGDTVREKSILQQDKGQSALIEAFVKNHPLNPEEFLASSLLTLAAQASLERQTAVNIADFARTEYT